MQFTREKSVEISIVHKNTSDIEMRTKDDSSATIDTREDSTTETDQSPQLKSSELDGMYDEIA